MRDRAFLDVAILAAVGGVAAIAAAIGFPLWAWLHGRPATPAFFFFSLWGIAALCGAAMSVHTYLVSNRPPERPPRGGLPVSVLHPADAAQPESDERSTRKAA